MKTTGKGAEWAPIPQTGDYADQLRKNLEKIKLPQGFKISLFAITPDARHIAVGPQGVAVFVGTRKSDVWVITDRNKDRVADDVKRFAPTIDFKIPNGVCFSKDGFLFLVEQIRVLTFPAAEFFYESPDVAVGEVVPQGKLIPPEEESYNLCAVCHGVDGIGKNPDVPNLAGESTIYLEKQLKAFKSGERKHEQMSIIAQGLEEKDIADVAAWYSSLKISVQVPQ